MKRTILSFLFIIYNSYLFSQDVFDIGVRNIEIFFSESNWDDTLDLYYANNIGQRLIADSILIDGVADHDVGVKYKGNSSYNVNNAKNPLNIRLDYINNGQSINGYNVLKLSNGFRDPTFIREVLGYEIAREYMPASKATYANVSVNGVLIGLYTCVQSVDDDFTNEHFYERKGPFFKTENTGAVVPGCITGPIGIWKYYSDTNCLPQAYEIQSTNDWTQLGNFLDTLNNQFSFVENVLDIDRTLWMMAFSNLTVTLDGPINNIPHNFYMFKDNNGRFSPILWDLNGSFGTFTNGLPTPVTVQSLQNLDVFHGLSNTQNRMTNKIFSDDMYKRMYIAHMKTILNEQFANNNYISRANQLQSVINADISLDPNGFYTYADFLANINSSVGANNSVIGLSELMNTRISYLQSLNEFTSSSPVISNISSNPTLVLPYNPVNITANITNSNYAYLAYRFKFADKFEKVEMYDDGNHGDGTAGDGVFGATINTDARDIQYYIYAENSDAGIFSPERAEHVFHQLPVVSSLVINEIMASNLTQVADQDGEYDDWVELYNGGVNPINLSGFHLSDNENILDKWTFPNVTIQPDDYLIIWCDTAGTSQSGLHTTYRLSADQEEVYLSDPTGTIIDAVHFVNMPTDQAYARVPNGSGVFTHQSATYNSANSIVSSFFDADFSSNISVYPNPVRDRFFIVGNSDIIEVYNLLGNKIYSSIDIDTHFVDVSSWVSGVYFLKSGNKTVKIIKQ